MIWRGTPEGDRLYHFLCIILLKGRQLKNYPYSTFGAKIKKIKFSSCINDLSQHWDFLFQKLLLNINSLLDYKLFACTVF